MKRYPSVPRVGDAPSALFDGGHLWVQEWLAGAHLRFRLGDSGVLQFGDSERTFDEGAVPLAYEHAVRHVRRELDREALRAAIEDPTEVVFFAVAMHRRGVAYEWHRTPSVLGFDVWDGSREQFLPPDAVEAVFERLGLRPVNAFRKEVRAADFDSDAEAIPDSAWRDGPAAGVFLRNKTGERAVLPNPNVETETDPEPLTRSADELADRYATDARLRRVAAAVESPGGSVAFDPLFERAYESVIRELHGRLEHGRTAVDASEFRSALAARTREWLAERES